jgi:hypothetical protein
MTIADIRKLAEDSLKDREFYEDTGAAGAVVYTANMMDREPQLAAFALAVLEALDDFKSDDDPRRGVAWSIDMAIERRLKP